MTEESGGSGRPEFAAMVSSWVYRMDPQGDCETKAWFASGMEESIQLPGTMNEGGKGIPNTQQDFTINYSAPHDQAAANLSVHDPVDESVALSYLTVRTVDNPILTV